MTYSQLLEKIKELGFEQWSWVAAILTGIILFIRWLLKSKPAIPVPTDYSNSAQDHASVGAQISGEKHTITVNAGVTTQELLDRISAKDKELGAKEVQLQQIKTAHDVLSQENLLLRKQGVETVNAESAKPNASKLAKLAKQELLQGNLDAASSLLRQLAADQAHSGLAQLHQAAQFAKEDGALWIGRDIFKAIESFELAHRYQNEDLNVLGNLVRLHKSVGKSDLALRYAQKLVEITERRYATEPSNNDLKSNLSVSYDHLALILLEQGKSGLALSNYQKSLQIRKLIAADSIENVNIQRDLSISHELVADILQIQGAYEIALNNYQKSLEIREKLLTNEPENSERMRDLSVSYEKLADILRIRGEYENALNDYQKSLVISENLIKREPKNTDFQRDLSVSYEKIGNVFKDIDCLSPALEAYQTSLEIRVKLAAIDVNNNDWQRDLSVSYERIADILKKQGDFISAFSTYHLCLDIREKLAHLDPKNNIWQRELAVVLSKLAASLKHNNVDFSQECYQRSLEITEKLVLSDPENISLQIDLAAIYYDLAGLSYLISDDKKETKYLLCAWKNLENLRCKGILTDREMGWNVAIKNRLDMKEKTDL